MLVRSFDEDVSIIRPAPEELGRWRPAFVGAYQTIFEGEPYFERFHIDDAEAVYRKLTSVPGNITLLAVKGESTIVGFGMGIPLANKPDVARNLTGLAPVPHAFYFAELGVMQDYRARGLGRTLVQERLKLIDTERFSHVILRVAASRNASYDMYLSMGFEDMGVYMEVTSMRTDGRVTTDRRLFMCCVISQIKGATPK